MQETRKDADIRGLTAFGRSVAFAGAALLFAGLVFGSYPYLLCALFLLGVALWSRQQPAPQLQVARVLSTEDMRAGDPLDVAVDLTNVGPAGAFSFHEKVPDVFLMDSGTNFGAAWVATGAGARLRYRLRAPRRGQHAIGALRATAFDPLFLQTSPVIGSGVPTDVLVHPRQPPVPRIRTGAAWGRTHLPGGDKASRGILTNDFRELRPYERGDPLKKVNWKATARQSREELNLIVNDYEVEGKKVVWLFTDASPYTVGGTTLQNAFDELAAATLAVAGHYLDQGHRVGFTLYGSGAPRSHSESADVGPAASSTRILYADSGELQERRIAALLATADPGQPGGDNITKAVEVTKGFIAREKPLLFVFTLAGRDPELSRALVSARALASTGRRAAPIVCVTPVVEELPPAQGAPTRRKRDALPERALTERVVAINERAQLKGLERRGVTVIRYHPGRTPLSALLARGVFR